MGAPPSLWIVIGADGRPEFAAEWRDAAMDHIKDAIEIEVDETASQWVVREYVPVDEITRLRAEVVALKKSLEDTNADRKILRRFVSDAMRDGINSATEIVKLTAEVQRLRGALDSILQYGADTLSGRTDDPDDRKG